MNSRDDPYAAPDAPTSQILLPLQGVPPTRPGLPPSISYDLIMTRKDIKRKPSTHINSLRVKTTRPAVPNGEMPPPAGVLTNQTRPVRFILSGLQHNPRKVPPAPTIDQSLPLPGLQLKKKPDFHLALDNLDFRKLDNLAPLSDSLVSLKFPTDGFADEDVFAIHSNITPMMEPPGLQQSYFEPQGLPGDEMHSFLSGFDDEFKNYFDTPKTNFATGPMPPLNNHHNSATNTGNHDIHLNHVHNELATGSPPLNDNELPGRMGFFELGQKEFILKLPVEKMPLPIQGPSHEQVQASLHDSIPAIHNPMAILESNQGQIHEPFDASLHGVIEDKIQPGMNGAGPLNGSISAQDLVMISHQTRMTMPSHLPHPPNTSHHPHSSYTSNPSHQYTPNGHPLTKYPTRGYVSPPQPSTASMKSPHQPQLSTVPQQPTILQTLQSLQGVEVQEFQGPDEDSPDLDLYEDEQSTLVGSAGSDKKKRLKGSVCTICLKHILRDMTRHMRIHDEKGRFQCVYPREECSHKTGNFNRPYDYKKHLLHAHFLFDDPKGKTAHTLTDKLPLSGCCKACNQRFVAQDWLNEHVLTKNPDRRCQYIPIYGQDEK